MQVQSLRVAEVTFYKGERGTSPHVTVRVEEIPLQESHYEAVVRAAEAPEVKRLFGDDYAPDYPAAVTPIGGPADAEVWKIGRYYKAGGWNGHRPNRTEDDLVAA
jgi:hypothetical protein